MKSKQLPEARISKNKNKNKKKQKTKYQETIRQCVMKRGLDGENKKRAKRTSEL